MQRLIEQPTGDGELFEGTRLLGRVHYHLSVYQHFSDDERDTVPASFTVDGRLEPFDPVFDLSPLRRRRAEVRLQLGDGRVLMCGITSGNGQVRSTERGLFTP